MTKYYWLVYSHNNAGGGKTYVEDVTWIHPFEYMDAFIKNTNSDRSVVRNIALFNWKEITKKEFDLYKKIVS